MVHVLHFFPFKVAEDFSTVRSLCGGGEIIIHGGELFSPEGWGIVRNPNSLPSEEHGWGKVTFILQGKPR